MNFKPISEAPKNATHFVARDSKGIEFDCHFAEDLSGEEQPAFSGFFKPIMSDDGKRVLYFAAAMPVEWRPYSEGEERLK